MVDFEKQFRTRRYAGRETLATRVFARVYGWMALGLAVSGGVAWWTFASGAWEKVLQGPGFWGCLVAEIVLVVVLTAAIRKISAPLALALFLGYAALNGLTLSVLFVAYDIALIQNVFFITAGMFAGLALWGTFTKNDLSSIGSICGMALWGLIIAMVVNIFLGSSSLDLVISFVGILVFTGLTMYDAKRIKELAHAAAASNEAALQKVGVLGALTLYLDFVNLFLYLLRMFDRNR